MAFTSYDDIITEVSNGKRIYMPWQKTSLATTGVAGSWFSAWTWTGYPPAGGHSGTALNAQVCNDTTTGAIYHGGNVSTDTKHLSIFGAQVAAATAVPGRLLVLDRLLYYPGLDANSAATQNLVNGSTLTRYTDGKGVQMFLEVTTALGAGAANFSATYTNSDGTGGRALGATSAMIASAAVARLGTSGTGTNNRHPFLPLAGGDAGVRSVQSVSFSAGMGAGSACALILAYPLAELPLPAVNVSSERDFIFQLASLPRIYDGACLMFLVYEPGNLVASTPYNGYLEAIWG